MTSAHGVVCASVCLVCVCVWSGEEDGKLERRGKAETAAAGREGEGVNINHDDPGGRVCAFFLQSRSVLPAVVQKMRGQHGDEDVLPVHREEQSSRSVDTCG